MQQPATSLAGKTGIAELAACYENALLVLGPLLVGAPLGAGLAIWGAAAQGWLRRWASSSEEGPVEKPVEGPVEGPAEEAGAGVSHG